MIRIKPKIVIIDDDLANLDILCCELCDFYEIYPVSDGLFTWQALEKIHPDLIILNSMTPQINGNPLPCAKQTPPIFGEIPVLFIIAETILCKAPRRSCKSMNCITKPYDIDEVLTKIDHSISAVS